MAPHVWEAPGARMAEMEATTGNLPKETTRSQWAWPGHRHSFFERGETFKLWEGFAKVVQGDCLTFTILDHFRPFEHFWWIGPFGPLHRM